MFYTGHNNSGTELPNGTWTRIRCRIRMLEAARFAAFDLHVQEAQEVQRLTAILDRDQPELRRLRQSEERLLDMRVRLRQERATLIEGPREEIMWPQAGINRCVPPTAARTTPTAPPAAADPPRPADPATSPVTDNLFAEELGPLAEGVCLRWGFRPQPETIWHRLRLTDLLLLRLLRFIGRLLRAAT